MSDRLGINYRLEITVLTPLHVGNSVTLLQGFDFAVQGGRTYRLNEEAILNEYWPEDPVQQKRLLGQPLSALLSPQDYQRHPEYFHYVLSGEPELGEVREHIKDASGRPYLPGSSLKGALRTALLRVLTAGRTFRRSDFARVDNPHDPKEVALKAKEAAQPLEKSLLGSTANRSVLRALHLGDSAAAPLEALALWHVRMANRRQVAMPTPPGSKPLIVAVEAIRPGTVLTATLRLDTWLLDQRSPRGLDWSESLVQRVRGIATMAQRAAVSRLQHERSYHARRGDTEATRFYEERLREARGDWPENEFLLQVGFAGGWRSKVVLDQIADDDPLLEQLVRDFHLDRGSGRGQGYRLGQPFPKNRHLAYGGGQPALPMVWLRVRMIEEESP